jgi:hypothetical protein
VLGWVASNKDLIALLISLLALVIGLATVLIAVRQARLDTYARMHEALVQHTAAHGRKLLFLAWKDGRFPGTADADWDQINHALALYDTLGTYVRRRLVPRRLVLAAWYKQLLAIEKAAAAFQEHRRKLGISQPWVGLGYLFVKASKYSREPWRRGSH